MRTSDWRIASAFSLVLLIPTVALTACPPVLEWTYTQGGAGASTDIAYAIAPDGNGGYFVGGESAGRGLLIRLTSTGTATWSRTVSAVIAGIGVDGAGNAVICMGTSAEIRKYDSSGSLLWSTTFNGALTADAKSVAVANAGDLVVAGYAAGNWLVRKYSADGAPLWVQTYNGVGVSTDVAKGVAIDTAGNVVVVGYETLLDGNTQWLVRKYDPAGTLTWSRSYAAPVVVESIATAVVTDAGQNVIVVGYERANAVGTQYYWRTIKYDSAGAQAWTQAYTGAHPYSWDYAYAVAVDGTGNIYVAGKEDRTDVWQRDDWLVIKYGPSGAWMWSTSFDFGGARRLTYDGPYGIAVGAGGQLAVAGYQDLWNAAVWSTWRVNTYQQPAACFAGGFAPVPNPVYVGQQLTIALDVSNPGEGSATGVVASLSTSGGLEAVSGPAPVGPLTIGVGGAQGFVWTVQARAVGAATIRGIVRGMDSAKALPISGEMAVAVTVVDVPDEIAVSGWLSDPKSPLTVVLSLKTDVDEVVIEVFTPAMAPVYKGTWRNVSRLERKLVITGHREWVSGLYLVRATARYVDGSKKRFAPAKFYVR